MADLVSEDRADAHRSAIDALVAAAVGIDGVTPFNDDTMLSLDARTIDAVVSDTGALLGAALAHPIDDGIEAELVVHPDSRRRGHGLRLVAALEARVAPGTDLVVWAHGDLEAARGLASATRMHVSRVLYKLGRDVVAADADAPAAPADVRVTTFDADHDADAFLALNARVFHDHPEQGSLDRAGLDARMAQSWFDPAAFLLARDAATDALLGYNWLKIDGDEGEIYVIGVAGEAAGRGLGRALMHEGLRVISASGVARTTLYVEGDNERALSLYRSLGYGDDAIDVQYRRTIAAPGREDVDVAVTGGR